MRRPACTFGYASVGARSRPRFSIRCAPVRVRTFAAQRPVTRWRPQIFTHINVSDIGAFAPRPYDLEATARTRRRRLWVVAAPDDDPSPKDKWYERIENNGWRPVQHSVLSRVTTPLDVAPRGWD